MTPAEIIAETRNAVEKVLKATARNGQDLTDRAQEGYDNPAKVCPYYATSLSGAAFLAGQARKKAGKPRPQRCEAGRGHSITLDGESIKF